jgi:hypothetical protein
MTMAPRSGMAPQSNSIVYIYNQTQQEATINQRMATAYDHGISRRTRQRQSTKPWQGAATCQRQQQGAMVPQASLLLCTCTESAKCSTREQLILTRRKTPAIISGTIVRGYGWRARLWLTYVWSFNSGLYDSDCAILIVFYWINCAIL